MLISPEYMIMERRMVLNKHNVQDNSVDHGKCCTIKTDEEKFHPAALKICILISNVRLFFFKDFGLRLFSEFVALCNKKKERKNCFLNLATHIYWSIVWGCCGWGVVMTRRDT